MQARVSQDQEHFLLNPFGMLYSEVTASTLIKVDMQVSYLLSNNLMFVCKSVFINFFIKVDTEVS